VGVGVPDDVVGVGLGVFVGFGVDDEVVGLGFGVDDEVVGLGLGDDVAVGLGVVIGRPGNWSTSSPTSAAVV
jgi:hypothetical protein